MKHILQVLKFEFFGCVKSKSFIISTTVFILLIVLMTFLPGIMMSIMDSEKPGGEGKEKPVIAVLDMAYNEGNIVKRSFEAAYQGFEIKTDVKDRDELVENVNSAKYRFGVIINEPLSFTYITKNNSLTSNDTQNIGSILQNIYRTVSFEKLGVDPEKSAEILSAQVKSETFTTGTDQSKNFWSAYLLMMLLYMAIIMYGQMVSQSVVSEKNSRAMEMLITCAKPSHLMFGKVFGSGLAGLSQMVLIISAAVVSMKTVSTDMIPDTIRDFLNFRPETIGFALLFFILGYFIYSFLMGALASLASRSEDLNTLTSPVMFFIVIAFMVVVFAINAGTLNGTLMTVCSYIPFTAPIAMFARVALSDVALWEIILSVAVQLVSVYLLGMLAAAIYRIGVLLYGKTPKPTEIIKLLIEQHKTNKTLKASKKK